MKNRRDILSILFLTSINLLIRIPRCLSTAQGLDGFYVVWEAELIFQGLYFSKGFNLGHLLGLYPFSGYPMGTLYVMSFFLLLTNHNIMASILLYDYFFTIIFVLGLYYLSKKLKLNFYSTIFFVLFASTQPIVLQYSYFNSSARLPFFAIAPFAIGLLIDWLKTKKHYKLAISALIISFLGFFHRISLLFIIVLSITLLIALINFLKSREEGKERNIGILRKINTNKYIQYLLKRKWIAIVLISYIVSPFIFKDIFRPAFDLKDLITIDNVFLNFIFRYIQMFTDQWFRIGLPLLLTIFCILVLLHPKNDEILIKYNCKSEIKYLLYFTTPFLLLTNNVYSYYFFFLAYALIPVVFFEIIVKEKNQFKVRYTFLILSSFLVFLFILTYHLLVRSVGPYSIIAGCIFCISLIFLVVTQIKDKLKFSQPKKFLTKRKLEIILTLIMLLLFLNALFQIDRHTIYWNRDGVLFSYVSEEEMDLANFLKIEGFGVFDSFDLVLSTHVAALSGWLFVQDMHSISANILYNDTNMIDGYDCSLKPFWQWYERELYACNFRTGSIHYKDIITNNHDDPLVLNLLLSFQVKYFITAKNSSLVEFWDGTVDSNFIRTLQSSNTTIAYITENFLVWNVSTLY